MIYNVKIDAFEGPLDLLLHLIHTLEIDIYDIPVSEITEQYLLYIHTMKELELDVASEYLVMAATLLAIKSRMLLPKHEEDLQEDDELSYEEDPRDELVEKLLEYKKYKAAAIELQTLEQERSLMFSKPPTDLTHLATEKSPQTMDLQLSIYDMLGAYHKLLRRKKLQKPLHTKVARQDISIETRMSEILNEIRSVTGRVSFDSLFPYYSREHIVITFLAILELLKRNEIFAEQENNFADLYIVRKEGVVTVG
ncbi:MAG: segregation/condensation protein A [Bacillus sp. (in: firmicutes)]